MTVQSFRHLGDLRQLINSHYRADEVRHLCIDLGLDYDGLPGETNLLKVNALIRQHYRSGQISELIIRLRDQNPDIPWPDLPINGRGQIHSKRNGFKGQPKSILQLHFEELRRYLRTSELSSSNPGSEYRQIASAKTLETLHRLDKQRKKALLLFLQNSDMICGREPLIDLSGADLRGVDLSWAQLSNVNLNSVDLSWSNLTLANLEEANLSGAILRGATAQAHLVGAELIGADLRESNLAGARLSGANLAGANLRLANMSNVDVSGANLVGADLSLANLQAADLTDARLPWTILRLTNLREASLSGADLNSADLRDAEFETQQLEKALGVETAFLPDKYQTNH